MKDVQELFDKQQELKKNKKEITREYKDLLASDGEYEKITDELAKLREQKKKHELIAQRDMGARWEELEDAKLEEKRLKEMIADISLTTLMNGETLEVRDEYDTLYEPVYSVSFRKAQ